MKFRILYRDSRTSARIGVLETPHGQVMTPAFMPVASQGAVKGVTPSMLKEMGYEMILSNTYHLYLRPGHRVVAEVGGLHRFVGWDRAILTDSGGFQIYSLAPNFRVEEKGVAFASHIDGSRHFLTPEDVVEIQTVLGSDIMMPLDHFLSNQGVRKDQVKEATERTLRWAERSKKAYERLKPQGSLFAIVQGGIFLDLREECARRLVEMDFPGYAIGGLSVGEEKARMWEVVELMDRLLPQDKPRYLMGVGTPLDIAEAVARGVDLFDCVLPTRNARRGTLFTWQGKMNIKNARYASDPLPPDPACSCYTCRTFSRALLRHLYSVGDLNSALYNTIHNLHFYLDIIRKIRNAIKAGELENFIKELKKNWRE